MNSATLQVRVTQRTIEAQDICSFELVSLDGKPLPPFSAGAHIEVRLPGNHLRQYSLCNSPSETHRFVIGVMLNHEGRGGSRSAHESVAVGDALTIGMPRNLFPLVTSAKHSVLLAGGIGITPLLSMAEVLSRENQSFELHYFTRSIDRTAFRKRILSSPYASSVEWHHDGSDAAQKVVLPSILQRHDPETHLYVCGPTGFIRYILDSARGAHWQPQQLHYESFGEQLVGVGTETAFQVELARTGRIIDIAADRSIAQSLAAAGVSIETSCEQGVCGTCLTRVLQGTPDHRDCFLSQAEQLKNDSILPCCSRSLSPLLVLDL